MDFGPQLGKRGDVFPADRERQTRVNRDVPAAHVVEPGPDVLQLGGAVAVSVAAGTVDPGGGGGVVVEADFGPGGRGLAAGARRRFLRALEIASRMAQIHEDHQCRVFGLGLDLVGGAGRTAYERAGGPRGRLFGVATEFCPYERVARPVGRCRPGRGVVVTHGQEDLAVLVGQIDSLAAVAQASAEGAVDAGDAVGGLQGVRVARHHQVLLGAERCAGGKYVIDPIGEGIAGQILDDSPVVVQLNEFEVLLRIDRVIHQFADHQPQTGARGR